MVCGLCCFAVASVQFTVDCKHTAQSSKRILHVQSLPLEIYNGDTTEAIKWSLSTTSLNTLEPIVTLACAEMDLSKWVGSMWTAALLVCKTKNLNSKRVVKLILEKTGFLHWNHLSTSNSLSHDSLALGWKGNHEVSRLRTNMCHHVILRGNALHLNIVQSKMDSLFPPLCLQFLD